MRLRIAWLLFPLVLVATAGISILSSGCETSAPSEGLDLASIPLEDVRGNGKPTLAEFGWKDCIPCKQMKPILEELSIEYQDRLNVVIVEVYDHMDLARQYEIMTIPTQIVFDRDGTRVTSHIGLWTKDQIVSTLQKRGLL